MRFRVRVSPLGLATATAFSWLCVASCDGNSPDDQLVVIERNAYGEAPDFALPSLGSGQVALLESAGSVRLINFWATWCAPCREEMPSLEALHRRHRKSGRLVVLAVSVDDDVNAVRQYIETSGFTFPVLLDQHRVVADRFGVSVFPSSFVVDADGRVVDRMTGAVDWADEGLIALPALAASYGAPLE